MAVKQWVYSDAIIRLSCLHLMDIVFILLLNLIITMNRGVIGLGIVMARRVMTIKQIEDQADPGWKWMAGGCIIVCFIFIVLAFIISSPFDSCPQRHITIV